MSSSFSCSDTGCGFFDPSMVSYSFNTLNIPCASNVTALPVKGSLTGNCVTLVDTPTRFIVKHVRFNKQWFPFELSLSQKLSGVEGFPVFYASSNDPLMLATEYVPCSYRDWNLEDIKYGFNVLNSLRAEAANINLPHLSERHGVGVDFSEGQAIALTTGPKAIGQLAPELQNLQYKVVPAFNFLHTKTCNDVVIHYEPHFGNWVLSDSSPTLIDFGGACRGPFGFDETYFVSCFNAPPQNRLDLLATASVPESVIYNGLVFILSLMAACAVNKSSRPWAVEYLPNVISLASYLLDS